LLPIENVPYATHVSTLEKNSPLTNTIDTLICLNLLVNMTFKLRLFFSSIILICIKSVASKQDYTSIMIFIVLFLIVTLVSTQPPPPFFNGPSPNCRPLTGCNLSCPYRFRFGSDGCEICQCRSSPCINETAILPNVECDETPNGPKCPSTHDCVGARGMRPPPPISGSPPSLPRPPPPSPTMRGVCCIHVDFELLGIGSRPPPPRPMRQY
jgi:hypothetical protein